MMRTLGLLHLNVNVSDLARSGGAMIRRGERDGNGMHEVFAHVRDPDGYPIELSTQAILRQKLARSG